MKMKILPMVVVCALAVAGCGNARMKQLNPDGGTITLYSANGNVIRTFESQGKPEMHEGGHLYCKEKGSGRLIIIYGTYTFVEATGG